MNLTQRDKKNIWHPYTQMKLLPEAIGIVKAKDATLFAEDGTQYIDAISSWWVTLHGHSNEYIADKINEQLRTLEHCIFAGFTHSPAIELAEKLLPLIHGNMARIFYSDNGSTAVEVALKMAHQYHQNKGAKHKTKIIAIEGSYHGDTFGAMSVSARSLFTKQFNDLLFGVHFIPFPSKHNEDEALSDLENVLKEGNVSSFIAEPLIQGAGGMRMYDADILNKMFLLCKKYDCIVIADEVMTGFGRTGTLFACNWLKEAKPDIVCLSKGLTGGVLPMGATCCTEEIFDAFLSDDAHKTLYHGHSFTANPVGCTAALASLDLLLSHECQKNIQRIFLRHSQAFHQLFMYENVKDIRQTGTVLAIEIDAGETNYLNNKRDFIYQFFLKKNILMRPLGNIIYVLPPYCITDKQLHYVYDCIEELLITLKNK